jgi:hypothetical protein
MNTPESIMAGNTLLPPGSYLWQLLDSSSSRNIVQIRDQKTGHVKTTILAIPAFRMVPADRNELTFWETPIGSPRAVRNWFYPGENYGQEFPYPKHLPVIAIVQPHVFRSPLPARQLESHTAPASHETPKVAPTTTAAPVISTPSENQESWAVISNPSRKTDQAASTKHHPAGLWDRVKNLPLTATLAPLVGLFGLAAMGLYFLTRKNRKHLVSVQ